MILKLSSWGNCLRLSRHLTKKYFSLHLLYMFLIKLDCFNILIILLIINVNNNITNFKSSCSPLFAEGCHKKIFNLNKFVFLNWNCVMLKHWEFINNSILLTMAFLFFPPTAKPHALIWDIKEGIHIFCLQKPIRWKHFSRWDVMQKLDSDVPGCRLTSV